MTNSVLAVRPVVTPTILHLPPDVHSNAAAVEAIEWGECYGLDLDSFQQATLHAALGERVDGSWAAGEVADFEGRQAGKNDTAKVRQGAGVDLFGERLLIHTAHEFATANEDFLRLVALYENWDELRSTVARIRYANGEQGIEFLSGARIKYRARTGGAGRGFTKADVVFYDEAQHLAAEHLAASLPTMLANPNFQAWYMGSGALAISSQAWKLRRRALTGNGGRLAYTENTAQDVTLLDNGAIVCTNPPPESMLDEDVLQCHPGYASGRVTRDGMVTMFDGLGPDLFAREILCCWEPEPGGGATSIIPRWPQLADPDSVIVSHQSWAIAVSPVDQGPQWATIGKAGRTADGRLHVEWVEGCHKAGTAWIVPKCVELYGLKAIPLRVHKSGPEGALIKALKEAGVEVVEVSTADVAQSTGDLIGLANADPASLVHIGQGSLDKALRGAVLRMSSDGASIWSQRSSSVEITPLVAVTVAAGGVADAGSDSVFVSQVLGG